MNFNVYVRKNTGQCVNKMAADLHRSRNSIVNEALEEWLLRHSKTVWPKDFFDFEPIDDVPDFKKLRKDLKRTTSRDPLK